MNTVVMTPISIRVSVVGRDQASFWLTDVKEGKVTSLRFRMDGECDLKRVASTAFGWGEGEKGGRGGLEDWRKLEPGDGEHSINDLSLPGVCLGPGPVYGYACRRLGRMGIWSICRYSVVPKTFARAPRSQPMLWHAALDGG